MDEREFEQMLERLMKQDFSAGTEAFRDALLGRCLAVLDTDVDCAELDDSELDLLAAAGDSSSCAQNTVLEQLGVFGDNGNRLRLR